MRRHISIILTASLLLSLFMGIGGSALAAGDGVLNMPGTVEAFVGQTVNITADVTNDTGDKFMDYRIKLGTTVKYHADATLEIDGTASDIPVSFTATQEIIDAPYISFSLEYKTASSGDSWIQGDVAAVHVNKKELTASLAASVTASNYYFKPGAVITLTFKINNTGEAGLSNVLIKADNINGGKALNLNNPLTIPAHSSEVKFTYNYTTSTNITITPYITYTAEGQTGTQRFDAISGAPITLTQESRDVNSDFTVSNSHPDPGEDVTFTLTLTNNGNVNYTNLSVSWNGEDMGFSTSKLNAGQTATKTYTMSFDKPTDVQFLVSLKDYTGAFVSFKTSNISILLPVDPNAVQSGLGLVINVDRPQITTASSVTFSGYIFNNSDFTLSEVSVDEPSLGAVYSISELEPQTSRQSFSKTVTINETTTYTFTLTAKDRNGQVYTVTSDPIIVSVVSTLPSPTDITSGAPEITGTVIQHDTGSDNSWLYIIAAILGVLIVIVGIAIFMLWRGGRTPSGSKRPSGKMSGKMRYKSGPRKSSSRGFRDRNNF